MQRRTVFVILITLLIFGTAGGLAADRRTSRALYKKSETQDDLAALKTLGAALRQYPGNIKARYRLGFLYQKMNRKPEAEKHYRAVLRRSGCHLRALNNLGGIRLDLGQAREAETLYRKALRCDRRFYPAHYNLANILRDRGELQAAVKSYGQAIQSKPDHARSHHNLGIVYYHLASRAAPGRPAGANGVDHGQQALHHLKTAIELKPEDALTRFNYARVLAGSGKRTLALRELKAAERYSRRQPSLRYRIRQEYQRLKYQKAGA